MAYNYGCKNVGDFEIYMNLEMDHCVDVVLGGNYIDYYKILGVDNQEDREIIFAKRCSKKGSAGGGSIRPRGAPTT